MDRIRCEKCKAESFYCETTKIYCVSCWETETDHTQRAIDAAYHYRNLAIELGARPNQMTNGLDRRLCEKWDYYKSRPDDSFTWKDDYPDAWGQVEKLEAENAELQRRLHNLEQYFVDEPWVLQQFDRMPGHGPEKLGL